ncbi:MAG TPA: MFS transporter [Planctomycetota bacterium]
MSAGPREPDPIPATIPASTTPANPDPKLWINIWTLGATIFCTLTCVFSWWRVASPYLRSLGASDREISWLFLLLMFAGRVPAAAGGWISDKIGRKSVIIFSTVTMGISFIGVAFAPSPALVTAAIGLAWVFGSFQHASLLAIQAESVPVARRGIAIATVESCAMVGITLGPLIEAKVFEWSGSLAATWRLLALVTSAVYLLVAVARITFLRETDRRRAERTPFKFDTRRLALPLAITVLFWTASYLTIDGPSVALYLKDVTRGNEATVGYVNFLGGAAAIAAAILGGWLADAWGAARVMAVSAMGAALVLLPFAIPGATPGLDRALFSLVFFPIEMFFIANAKFISSIGPPGRRGLYVGIVSTAQGLLASWGVVLSGYLYAGAGRASPMVAAAGFAVLAGLLTLVMLRLAKGARDPGHLA